MAEQVTRYKTVIDPRTISGLKPYDKPLGMLYHDAPQEPQIDANTGLVKQQPATPKPVTAKQLRAMQSPDYEPDDKIPLYVGLQPFQESASIQFRLTVPAENCPQDVDQDIINNGSLVIKVKIFTANFNKTALNTNFLSSVYDSEQKSNMPEECLPYIVRRTPKLNSVKPLLLRVHVHYTNEKETLVTQNHFNNLVYEHQPTQRAVQTLRHMFSKKRLDFAVYIKDEVKAPFYYQWNDTVAALRKENQNGNIYRHFYTEKLQLTDSPHNIDTGSALKRPEDRPQIEISYAPTAYSTVFEMTTRLGVATKQRMECESEKVLQFNSTPGVIRIMEALGAGDTSYFAFLVVKTDIRLRSGDLVKINFRLENSIAEEDWDMLIIEPFSWCLQGELVGYSNGLE